MGKLVEATQLRYYGNKRIRVGEQFVMADKDFEREVPVLDGKGQPMLDKEGNARVNKEEYCPMGVVVVEDGYEDPIVISEADLKKQQAGKPMKRVAAKKQPDDLRQGGAFDIHPESGLQVTGQVAPARPAASSVAMDPSVAPAKGKGSGSKDVL